MTHLTKVWAVGLLTLVLPLTVAAQQPNARARAANNDAEEGQQHNRFLVLHALNKAISGSDLQFAAQFSRGGRPQDNQGQEAENRQDRRDENQRDRAAENRQEDNQNRQRNQQSNQQLASQLEQQARQEFAASDRMLDAVEDDIRSEAGGDRSNDRANWTRRLRNEANRYTDTLRSLAGVREGDDRESGSVGNRGQADDDQNRRNDRNDRDRGNRSDSNQNAQQQQRLNRGDIARVFLINHAVRQATEAFYLNQWSNRQQGNNAEEREGRGSAQRLQERIRRLEADSNQILQRVQASANQQDNDDNRRDQDRDRDRDQDRDRNQRNQDRDQQGRASIRQLAEQAEQLIETLQRASATESR
jgi:hypothetical protein